MIRVEYGKKFLKDLKKIERLVIYSDIIDYCFSILTEFNSINEIKNIKKITGHKNYYRIKFGDYRVGLKLEKNTIFLMRVLHRKEIYKYFP